MQIREVLPGESVGYGATWRSDRPGLVAVLGLGYADGLPRRLSNCGQAVVRGKRCPIVGRVSMDLTAIDVTDIQAAVGDWAELFGPALPVDEVAKTADASRLRIAHRHLAAGGQSIRGRLTRLGQGSATSPNRHLGFLDNRAQREAGM